MFTGLIAAVGRVSAAVPGAGGVRITVDAGGLSLEDVSVGDSIAVNGVCLTVVALRPGGFEADVSRETLSVTTGFPPGAVVNLEKSLRLADRLGGHLVTGHVDATGVVRCNDPAGDNRHLCMDAPPALAGYIARKGSIAVNGVSLTVNEVGSTEFCVNIIPHTLSATNLGALAPGERVNLEVDLLARYVERMSRSST